MTDNTEELKPCPFCGGKATQHNWYPDECFCGNDRCIMFEKVVKHEQWNTRATPEPQPPMELVEKVARALAELVDNTNATDEEHAYYLTSLAQAALSVIMPELVKVRERTEKIRSHSLATNNLLDRREEIGRLNDDVIAALDKMCVTNR